MATIPNMVYAHKSGEIFDHPGLAMAVWDGTSIREPREEELIPLPEGSDLYLLPKRVPLGFSGKKKHLVEYVGDKEGELTAVSAFVAPAYVRLANPAYRTLPDASTLPLFCYGPLGWANGRFWTTALRIDPETRQDPGTFDLAEVRKGVERDLHAYPRNRLLHQLRRCALEYCCRAAQNFFLKRFEAPLPSATHCNANCIGCISYQEGEIPVTQERIETPPSPRDIAEVTSIHFRRVKNPIASFGQGCEGEPLLRASLLLDAVRLIRKEHPNGTVNLNTNASRPDVVEALCREGMSSIRVSLSSPIEENYNRYHRPVGYAFADVLESIRRAKSLGKFVSLNLLVFPGLTDRPGEVEALRHLIQEYSIDMIQWRNLNIDPEFYIEQVGRGESGVGLYQTIETIKSEFPKVRHGYFNPFLA